MQRASYSLSFSLSIGALTVEFETLVHGKKANKYTFYVVKGTAPQQVIAVIFKNTAHFFEVGTDNKKSFFESSLHQKLIQKVKHKYGVGKVENHHGIGFTIARQPGGKMEVRGVRSENGIEHDYTDEIFELLNG